MKAKENPTKTLSVGLKGQKALPLDGLRSVSAKHSGPGAKTSGPLCLLLYFMILSRLVDTFISRISLTMLPVPNSHNTVCVLSWEEAAIGRADPPVIPVAEEVSPNERL